MHFNSALQSKDNAVTVEVELGQIHALWPWVFNQDTYTRTWTTCCSCGMEGKAGCPWPAIQFIQSWQAESGLGFVTYFPITFGNIKPGWASFLLCPLSWNIMINTVKVRIGTEPSEQSCSPYKLHGVYYLHRSALRERVGGRTHAGTVLAEITGRDVT